ncbi:hypothetical protein IMG5_052770 [Ichthyophthirius multifiliis]|uniref:Transmembrane protein n=1 Tax=Ichthyophthirius multifiliis TaxID=5932 RepID=G0QMW2_ICHMU|nr:hypothetical protein IMG5_052770 [Ichthyophthirius multifiliis]EGR33443.1 hypothetical protein IMG5_052770 [Ichthyophthirius multifiliis]|eukprot:XP_004037429.1 hypothetical protein IMG5_052770 [Ichthyophthirius multifiliis]
MQQYAAVQQFFSINLVINIIIKLSNLYFYFQFFQVNFILLLSFFNISFNLSPGKNQQGLSWIQWEYLILISVKTLFFYLICSHEVLSCQKIHLFQSQIQFGTQGTNSFNS